MNLGFRFRCLLVEQSSVSQAHFFNDNRGENHLKKQRNCKICNSPEWLITAFTYGYHIEHLTYLQLIEMFEKYGVHLNIYNCHVHIQRHLEQKDFIEAEQKQIRWAKIDEKIAESRPINPHKSKL